MPEMTPVNSSAIGAVGYDELRRELHVQFKSGGTHVFHDVPGETHSRLLAAESIGRHFHQNIRGRYQSRKIGA